MYSSLHFHMLLFVNTKNEKESTHFQRRSSLPLGRALNKIQRMWKSSTPHRRVSGGVPWRKTSCWHRGSNMESSRKMVRWGIYKLGGHRSPQNRIRSSLLPKLRIIHYWGERFVSTRRKWWTSHKTIKGEGIREKSAINSTAAFIVYVEFIVSDAISAANSPQTKKENMRSNLEQNMRDFRNVEKLLLD